MNKEEAKEHIRVSVNKLFLSNEMNIQKEYADEVNYAYVDDNENFYRMVGLIR